jgi:hypothetical protein
MNISLEGTPLCRQRSIRISEGYHGLAAAGSYAVIGCWRLRLIWSIAKWP